MLINFDKRRSLRFHSEDEGIKQAIFLYAKILLLADKEIFKDNNRTYWYLLYYAYNGNEYLQIEKEAGEYAVKTNLKQKKISVSVNLHNTSNAIKQVLEKGIISINSPFSFCHAFPCFAAV